MTERALGPSQRGLLSRIAGRPQDGLTKSRMLGNDWRSVDRLEAMGLVDNRFVSGAGPTYFVNDAGRRALGEKADKT